MPVSVGRCGNKWCVKDPDGTTVPGGEHDTRGEAVNHAAAINANTEKGAMTEENGTIQSFSDNTTHVVVDNGTITYDPSNRITFPKLEPEVQKAIKEKGLEEAMMFGPESFDDLDSLREYSEKTSAITKVVSDFMSLVGNVLSWPAPDTAAKIKKLANEMVKRLPDEEEDMADMQEEEEEDNVDIASKEGFFVWKEADGTYRWLGVYSNKFRDNDRPAEILSEQAHKDFIDRVEKGELAYPDLYVWHIKSPIGVADLLAYDDAGFSIASGTIEEDFALALEKTSEDLAMSHGMPSEYIVRSKEDPTVITAYVSTEVSVLPRSAAANKRTDFQILKEEATMSIVPADKRQQVMAFIGEDLVAKLEAGLESKAKEAEAAGVEFKEESVDTEVTEEVQVQAEAEPATEEPAETEAPTEDEVKEEAEEAVAEADAENVQSATLEENVGNEAADGNTFVDKGELAETLAIVLGTFTEAIKGLNMRLDKLETEKVEKDEAEDASKQASEQLTELAASIPVASLQSMLMKQLGQPAESVIGTKEAKVHGNDKLSDAKPKETDFDEENPDPNSGLFFHRW